MDTKSAYLVVRERVADETLDGEVVILDQIDGTYFSVTGSGADIWELVSAGVSVEDTAAALALRYAVDEAVALERVAWLVGELVKDELLVAGAVAKPAPPAAGPRAAWVAPKLERFTDLQSLLLLDPIHDVDLDQAGWPRQAPKP